MDGERILSEAKPDRGVMTGPEAMRWDPYVLLKGENVTSFWEQHLQGSNRDVVIVLGAGFDPRMCDGAEILLNTGGNGVRDCLLLDYDEGEHSTSLLHSALKGENHAGLLRLFEGRGDVSMTPIRMINEEGRRTGAREAAVAVHDARLVSRYSDIVIDVSAMPRALFLALLCAALRSIDEQTGSNDVTNLHVIAAEDASFDARIVEDGPDEHPSPIPGLASALAQNSTSDLPRLWIPILGEHKSQQIKSVVADFRPSEICPVLPSPSRQPRRADALIQEYRELLFDAYRIEPSNFLYASEQNPFEAYRQVLGSIRRYNQSLEPLGGCTSCVSAFSSKLLSIGALLACYEADQDGKRVGVLHVEVAGHTIEGDAAPNPEIYQLWLAGECFVRV